MDPVLLFVLRLTSVVLLLHPASLEYMLPFFILIVIWIWDRPTDIASLIVSAGYSLIGLVAVIDVSHRPLGPSTMRAAAMLSIGLFAVVDWVWQRFGLGRDGIGRANQNGMPVEILLTLSFS